ncbi:MAG: histidine kinase [Gemmatimonadota bacterium]
MVAVPPEEASLQPARRSGRILWWCSVALWTVLSLADAVDYYAGWRISGMPASWGRALGAAFPGWMLWGLLSPLIFWICGRVRLSWPPAPGPLATHLGLSVLVGMIHTAVHASAGWYFEVRPSSLSLPDYYSVSLFDWMPINILMYWSVVGTYYGLDYYRRYQEARLEAAELSQRLTAARLDALQSQLHPHFLFNTLNAAVALVRTENGPGAIAVLTQLGDILRHLLHGTAEPEITLAEELAFLDRYLAIERIRFSNRLSVAVSVPEELTSALVPNLILQPLVENAIRHGLGADDAAGRLTISAAARGGQLLLEVRNDGPSLPGAWSVERYGGVGLNNTRSRLSHLYGESAMLSLANDSPSGVIARVTLPLHRTPARPPNDGPKVY